MLREKYQAFVIREQEIASAVIDGSLPAISTFIKNSGKGNIVTIHTMEGGPFLAGLSGIYLYCEDSLFLDRQLIPYLRSAAAL